MSTPAWMPVAQSYSGLKEIRGTKHNPTIVDFFEKVGAGWVKDDETAWCSAFVGACFEEVGIKGTGNLAARSWLNWGHKVTTPQYGDVVVFWRVKKNSWQGHVAYYVKEDDKYIYCLGGNQKNSVNVSRYAKSRLLGYRRPSTMSRSRTVLGAVTSGAGTSGATVVDTIKETQGSLAGVPLDWAQYAFVALAIAGLCLVLYARWDDLKKKGR